MLPYLIELRQRLLKILLVFGGFFVLFFLESSHIFRWFMYPLLQKFPEHSPLIATQITSSMLIPLNLASHLALVASTPFALFHFWRFISPGLYQRERQYISRAMITSLLLFSLGVVFCFFVVLPFVIGFLESATPNEVQLMPDITSVAQFISHLLILFGLCFQVPLICVVCVRIGVLSIDKLTMMRPYAIVAFFIIGMLLTPPDVFSQLLLALPLCALYELGILLARRTNRAQSA